MSYFKLKKDMPKHEIGDVLYLNSESEIYDWVDPPNYPLFKSIVEQDEDGQDFFEELKLDIKENDQIYYIDILGDVVEARFNNKKHLKLFLNNRIFKTLDKAVQVQEKINKIYDNDTDTERNREI